MRRDWSRHRVTYVRDPSRIKSNRGPNALDIACAFRPKSATGRACARSLARCASQCDAGSIKQAAIHGATVSQLRVIAGPAGSRLQTPEKDGTRTRGEARRQEKRKGTLRQWSRVGERKRGITGGEWSSTACYPRACAHETVLFVENQALSSSR